MCGWVDVRGEVLSGRGEFSMWGVGSDDIRSCLEAQLLG